MLSLAQEALQNDGAIAVIKADLSEAYRDYIACLNKQDWPKLGQFVHDEVIHNGRRVGYRVISKCWRETLMIFRTLISTSRC